MHILIVEDEWLIGDLLRSAVEALGHTADGPAMSSREAIGLLGTNAYDLVMIDTRLTDGHSGRVVEAVSRKAVPIVICSGHHRDALPAFARGFPLLSKPFAESEVSCALADAMAGRAST
jgi:DNA-binding response OmpR family regulator